MIYGRWCLAFLCLCSLLVSSTLACDGVPNNRPIYTQPSQLLKSTTNGKLFQVGTGQEGTTIRLLHVYGTPFEMGQAQGELLKDELVEIMVNFTQYVDETIAPYIKNLPKEIQDIILKDGPDAALQFELDMTRKWINQSYFEEAAGIAAGTGGAVNASELMRLNMFPELIRASCTMYGAWGPALPTSSTKLLQLRALDWGIDNPFVDYALVTIYHPAPGYGHAFATVGFTGLFGSITAYSQHIGLSEKVWLSYNGTYSPLGVPFHFMMRNAAQYDMSIDDFLNRIINNPRTCSIHLGVGSINDMQFRLVDYAHQQVWVWDDKNFPAYPPQHPQMNGALFYDKHVQPSHDDCLVGLMQQFYGRYTPEITIRNITAVHASGDMHATVYDYTSNLMYVSVAGLEVDDHGVVTPNTTAPAYNRPWFRLNMTDLLNLPL